MAALLGQVITLYIVVVFARIILSWFPVAPGSAMAGINDFLVSVTEPVLAPIRRALPPAGMFDLSPMVLTLGLIILRSLIVGA